MINWLHFLGRKYKSADRYEVIMSPNLIKLRDQYSGAWLNQEIPIRQAFTTDKELTHPKDVLPFKVAVALLKKIYIPKMTVLEVGCSSGYYSEVFKRASLILNYEGCDYSQSFVSKAKEKYPMVPFKVSNATKLDYNNSSFDLVISGCCLLHIVDYQKVLSETVRVSKKYVLFHRTPVIHTQKTIFLTKTGYGAKMLEIHFNENELMDLFEKNNLVTKTVITFSTFSYHGSKEPVFMKSYLCEKQ